MSLSVEVGESRRTVIVFNEAEDDVAACLTEKEAEDLAYELLEAARTVHHAKSAQKRLARVAAAKSANGEHNRGGRA